MSCEETFKECQANRSARIEAALANPANLGKANRVLADELGVSDKAVARHIAAMNATTVANDDKPKGYDPAEAPPAFPERLHFTLGAYTAEFGKPKKHNFNCCLVTEGVRASSDIARCLHGRKIAER